MRKRIIAGLISGMILLMSIWGIRGISAWLMSSEERHNLFMVGKNDVQIEEDFPKNEIIEGAVLKKRVEVKNTGTVPCYVRVKYYFSHPQIEEQITFSPCSNKWKKEADGYYYYADVVQPGEKTEVFMEKLQFGSGKYNDFDIIVYTETVQAEGFSSSQKAFSHLIPGEGGTA